MLVNLNQTEASVVILVGNRLDACGLSGSRITVQQRQLLASFPLTNASVLSTSFCFCKLVADQIIQLLHARYW